jgi:hypothetical protein
MPILPELVELSMLTAPTKVKGAPYASTPNTAGDVEPTRTADRAAGRTPLLDLSPGSRE